MEIILKYFPELNPGQVKRLSLLFDLYNEWNAQINVISRKDIDQLYLRHVLHSLSIAKVASFKDGSRVLDAGTGGGFPGIPLAIVFPGTKFHLVDSIGKKIRVVSEIANTLGLENIIGEQARVEELDGKYDFIVSRAVKSLDIFYPWVKNKIKAASVSSVPNGILYLKGGDVDHELEGLDCKHHIYQLSDYFTEDFYTTKYLIHLHK